jgi:hypothetical protein
MDLNHRRHKPADLQSALVDHLSTPPNVQSWREESNLQPSDYKSLALPLSHASESKGELYMQGVVFVKGFFGGVQKNQRFKQLYALRTGCERSNSLKKETYKLGW